VNSEQLAEEVLELKNEIAGLRKAFAMLCKNRVQLKTHYDGYHFTKGIEK